MALDMMASKLDDKFKGSFVKDFFLSILFSLILFPKRDWWNAKSNQW